MGQQEVGQVCEGVSTKWGRSVSVSARRGAGVCGGQQETGIECEGVSMKWCRSVRS